MTPKFAAIEALFSQYDEKWSALAFAGVADLWERDNPQPIYVGDEYAAPLVGVDELDRHWGRLASRLKRASVSSRCILLSRWSLTGRDPGTAHTGASWITWLLTAHGERYRIFHHMEAQVYLEEGSELAAHQALPRAGR